MSISISVITPCLDQAEYLPTCIQSVRVQSHQPVEHLVYDPGSTDASREVARRAVEVTLIAEPDAGQADAVRKGFQQAQGDVIGWLNADDRYADEDVLARVAARFLASDRPDVVYGRGRYERPDGEPIGAAFVHADPESLSSALMTSVGLLQPAVFVHRRVAKAVSGPDPRYRFAMDYDLWIRLAKHDARFAFLDSELAVATVHAEAKTQAMRGESLDEAIEVAKAHFGFVAYSWCRLVAAWNLTGEVGLVRSPVDSETEREIEARARAVFAEHNRNRSTIANLARRPWPRPRVVALVRIAQHELQRLRRSK